MKLGKYINLIFNLFLFLPLTSRASPESFNLSGRIVKPDGASLNAANVSFSIEVFSPGSEACLLYKENHTLNMSNSGGVFNISLGQGTRDSGLSFENTSTIKNIFDNSQSFSGLSCDNGNSYIPPSQQENRNIKIVFDDGTGPQTLTYTNVVRSVPYSLFADKLGGHEASDFLQVNNSGSYVLSQNNLAWLFESTRYSELQSLISGTSSQFMKSSPSASVGFNNQRITDVATPSSATDATNKNYVDSNVGGNNINTGALAAGDSGKVLKWDGTKWIADSASSTDNTKLPLDGSVAMTGSLNMGNQNISNVNNISVSGGIGVTNGINSSGNITALNQSDIRFGDSDGTANYVAIQSPTALASDITLTLPNGHGSGGQVLSNDGSGNLSWVNNVQSGSAADNVILNSSIPNCNANEKLQMSAGPIYTLSCVADLDTDTGITQLTGDISTASGSGSQSATISAGAVNNVKLANDAVTSTKILDGEIVNADISAVAAIADSKLATISTAGKVSNSATTATSTNIASAIVARDASGDFSAGTISATFNGDGSLLTSLNASNLGSGTVPFARIPVGTTGSTVAVGNDTRFPSSTCTAGNKMRWDGSAWQCEADADAGGDITGMTVGAGLSGGGTSGALTIDVDTGADASDLLTNSDFPNCAANQKLQMSAGPIYSLSCVNDDAAYVLGKALPAAPGVGQDGQVLKWDNGTNAFIWATDNTGGGGSGDIESVTAGTGLSGGGVSGSVTVGIAAGGVSSTELAGNAVTSTKILDGEIVNADISASAAIADSKLDTISTAGKVLNSATTATSANTASAIVARDASGDFSANVANLGSNGLVVGTNQLIVNTGMVGIGTATPGAGLHINSTSGIQLDRYSSNTNGAILTMRKARNTSSTPEPAESDDALFSIFAKGYKDSAWSNNVGAIEVFAHSQFTDSSTPTYMVFSTVSSGTSLNERMRIDNTGNVGIGTSNPGALLHVNGGIKLGNDASTCNAGNAGISRWNGSNFQGCNGSSWVNLDPEQKMILADEKSNADGGDFTLGAWRTRTLNTTRSNSITGASLTANQITLPAGTYTIFARAPGHRVDVHQAKLRNITDSSDTILGSSAGAGDISGLMTDSIVQGRFTITGTKVFELQHRCASTRNGDGLGKKSNFGVNEVYATIEITKE